MAGRRLPGTDVRLRRGRRDDLAAVQALLGPSSGIDARRMRRVLGGLGSDVYVAEAADGAVIGLVSLGYARVLTRGLVAVLDALVAAAEPATLREALVAFAEARARARGCRQLIASPAAIDEALRDVMVARGYGSGEGMVRWLQEDG